MVVFHAEAVIAILIDVKFKRDVGSMKGIYEDQRISHGHIGSA